MRNLRLAIFLVVPFFNSYSHGSNHSLRVIHQNELESLQLEDTLKNIYFESFKAVYKEDWSLHLEQAVIEGFETYIARFKKSQDMLLVATHVDTVVSGWALFYIEKDIKRAVLELICISPTYWRNGLGKKLISVIKDFYPDITSIAVVTRKINSISPAFYQSLGFKKTNFMLPEYNAEDMQGYELHL